MSDTHEVLVQFGHDSIMIEMIHWIQERVGDDYQYTGGYYGVVFTFWDKDVAMLFKLTYGGS